MRARPGPPRRPSRKGRAATVRRRARQGPVTGAYGSARRSPGAADRRPRTGPPETPCPRPGCRRRAQRGRGWPRPSAPRAPGGARAGPRGCGSWPGRARARRRTPRSRPAPPVGGCIEVRTNGGFGRTCGDERRRCGSAAIDFRWPSPEPALNSRAHAFIWGRAERSRWEWTPLRRRTWDFVGSPNRFGGWGKGMCGRTAGFHWEPQVDRTGR